MGPGYRLQLHSPLPVPQWEQRQELDLQKQAPLGAAAFSAWVGSTFCGGGVQPIAITTAANTIRSFVTVASQFSSPPELYPMIRTAAGK